MANKTHCAKPRELWLAAASFVCVPAVAAPNAAPFEAALHYFTEGSAADIVGRIDRARPVAVTPAEKEAVLRGLPPDGEIRSLDAGQLTKLAAARRILELHQREAVYEIKVIDVPQAAVALHARVVVLMSRSALDLVEPEELQALVAHEVGHEYFWADYLRGRQHNDRPLLQRLELLCDGIAIVTLRRAGIEPGRLTSALEKVFRYNRDKLGLARNEDDYPSIGDRRRFAGRLVGLLGRVGAPLVH